MNTTTKLAISSWGERLALLDHFKPDISVACNVFGVTEDELNQARDMQKVGSLSASKTIDVTKYSGHFIMTTIQPDSTMKPETATKKPAIPKKRGFPGVAIKTALLAVPTQPVDINAFMSQYKVSLPVLRQAKRFTMKENEQFQQQVGVIKVGQDKTTKKLMIWKVL